MKNSYLGLAIVGALIGTALPLYAQDGFYGGVLAAPRRRGCHRAGPGRARLWSGTGLSAPATEDAAQQTLLFGGYRWKSDISVEAAFNSRDQYALKAGSDRPGGRGPGAGRHVDSDLERRCLYQLGIPPQLFVVRTPRLCAKRFAPVVQRRLAGARRPAAVARRRQLRRRLALRHEPIAGTARRVCAIRPVCR